MLKNTQIHWRCTNRDCGWSAVLQNEIRDSDQPVCVCGSRLERSMGNSSSAYLDFLWDGDAATVPAQAQEEEQ